jgi:uncharacterized membrane protein YfcA
VVVVWAVAAGLAAGFVLGFLGAGGTIVGLPFLLFLAGLSPHHALGTNALGVSLIAAALMGWRAGHREVPLQEGIVFTLPGLVGILLGAHLGLIYPGRRLIFLLGILIFIVSSWIFYLSTQQPSASNNVSTNPLERRTHPISRTTLLKVIPTAFAVGFTAGFFAVGGGFMIVPGLMLAAGLDLPLAAASALLPISAFAALVGIDYILAGSVSIKLSLFMLVAGLAGGAYGIWLSKRAAKKTMLRAFGVFLALLGLYMLHPAL